MTDAASIHPFHYARRVQFGDTDMAGVAHFSRLLCFVEEAEHAALETLGAKIHSRGAGWPRARVEADFLAPARFGDTVNIHLRPARLGRSSLTWEFLIEGPGGRVLVRGRFLTCHVGRSPGGGVFQPRPLPTALVKSIQRLRKHSSRPGAPRRKSESG